MTFRISPLNHSHIPEVLAIEQSSHLTPWTEKILQQSFGPRSHNIGLFDVHQKQWQLVGYYFSESVAQEVSLENMCIAKSFQGKGLANKLMQDLQQFAFDSSAEEIWLEVRESNESAIALYKKFGFETVSIRKDYYRILDSDQKEHALLMKKTLSASTL